MKPLQNIKKIGDPKLSYYCIAYMEIKRSFHHAAVSVDDVSVGVKWYTENLSACVLYQDETWAFLKIGDTRIALVVPGEHPPHIAFEWSGARDFGPLVTHRDGTASLYIEDPFGNKIELMEPQNSG